MKQIKKSQGLPLNTIVIAILVIIVLVVIILFFTTNIFVAQDDINEVKGCYEGNPILSNYKSVGESEKKSAEDSSEPCGNNKQKISLIPRKKVGDKYVYCCGIKKE